MSRGRGASLAPRENPATPVRPLGHLSAGRQRHWWQRGLRKPLEQPRDEDARDLEDATEVCQPPREEFRLGVAALHLPPLREIPGRVLPGLPDGDRGGERRPGRARPRGDSHQYVEHPGLGQPWLAGPPLWPASGLTPSATNPPALSPLP